MIDVNHNIKTFDMLKNGSRIFLGTNSGDILIWEN